MANQNSRKHYVERCCRKKGGLVCYTSTKTITVKKTKKQTMLAPLAPCAKGTAVGTPTRGYVPLDPRSARTRECCLSIKVLFHSASFPLAISNFWSGSCCWTRRLCFDTELTKRAYRLCPSYPNSFSHNCHHCLEILNS
eukprot:SAG31_NODE_7441_length_1688_cov_1.761485_2_plen_139_part_00